MRSMIRGLVAISLATTPVAAAPVSSGAGTVAMGHPGFAGLLAPILRLPAALIGPGGPAAPLENSTVIRQREGRGHWTVELNDHGNGLFVELRGRVQFEWANIHFADGEDRAIELHRVTRGDGLYLLADFGGDRPVASVTLGGRARDDVAYVGLRLGRIAPGD